MKFNDNFETRIDLFLPAIPAFFVGIFADTFIFRWEDCDPYCTAILVALTVLVVPSIAWIRDLMPEWHFRLAIKKELNDAFGLMKVGRGLGKRLIVTVK